MPAEIVIRFDAESRLPTHYVVRQDDATAAVLSNPCGVPVLLDAMIVDNPNTVPVYVHMYDAITPVLGTDPQQYQLPLPPESRQAYVFDGARFGVGLSWAVSTDRGTGAHSAPASPCTVWAFARPA